MSVVLPVTDAPNPALIFEHLTAYQRPAALRAAIDIGLFDVLGDGPADAATLASRCAASERAVRILADYLVTLELLAKDGERYRHTATSAMFLDGRSPASMAPAARLLCHADLLRAWEHLTEIVRNGRTVLPGQGSVEPNNPLWVEFARSMVSVIAPGIAPVASAVLAARNGPIRVLDIAAGHGMFGIEIAKQNPAAHIVALDWEAVLAVARENAEAAGVLDRVEFLAGSAFELDLGGPYDAVLLTNFLHHFDEPTCVALLKRVRAALAPGGIAVTLEFVPNADRVSPPVPAQFAMMMLGTTAAGDAYTFDALERMHRAAGFARLDAHAIPGAPETVLTGRT